MFLFVSYPFSFSEFPFSYSFSALLDFQNSGKICEILEKTAKNAAIFNENFEIRERCKGVHCVDLGESFPTSI